MIAQLFLNDIKGKTHIWIMCCNRYFCLIFIHFHLFSLLETQKTVHMFFTWDPKDCSYTHYLRPKRLFTCSLLETQKTVHMFITWDPKDCLYVHYLRPKRLFIYSLLETHMLTTNPWHSWKICSYYILMILEQKIKTGLYLFRMTRKRKKWRRKRKERERRNIRSRARRSPSIPFQLLQVKAQ